ncbi:hypothetical protein [Aristaeella hokkaidonensis]|uniref:Uncharacterized protein n=1 Tax=Aristaeella hokkaidonensis TaxID=3046382 RepID=A0AC61N1R3_9FIRM|nr:hypothetical protein [Aristaeella hokkaidonensis]QUC66120.1 hypothetical protein JYE49_09585 [Aristaeella hokkaidonensis]SNT94875.1 hypothetical protein SAMN06297421_107104 [Aristaeella hokkaidonensis]
MSWFALKHAKTIVYIPTDEYNHYVKQFMEKQHWTTDDKISSYIVGTRQNKEKNKNDEQIIYDLEKAWRQDRVQFQKDYSFDYRESDIKNHIYELIKSFCEINPPFRVMVSSNKGLIEPLFDAYDLINGNRFFIRERYEYEGKKPTDRYYEINVDDIQSIKGCLTSFSIEFKSGKTYVLKTNYDGKCVQASITIKTTTVQKHEGKKPNLSVHCEPIQPLVQNAEKTLNKESYGSVQSVEGIKNKFDNLIKRMHEIETDYEKYAEVENPFVDFGNYGDKWAALAKEARSQLIAIKMYINSDNQQSKSNEPLGFESVYKLRDIRNALVLFTDYTDSMRMLMLHLDQKAHGKTYSIDDYLKELESTIAKRKRAVSAYNNIDYVLPNKPIKKTIAKSNTTGLSDEPLEYFVRNDEKSIHQDNKANTSVGSTKAASKDNSLRRFLLIAVLIVVLFNAIAFISGKKTYTGTSQKIYATSYEGYDYLLIFNSSSTMSVCQYREDPKTVSGFYGKRTYYNYDAICYNRIGPISICPQLSLFFWNNIIIGQNDTAAKIHFTAFRNDFLECKSDAVSGSFNEVIIDHGYGIDLGKLHFTEITDYAEKKYAVSVWNAFNEYAEKVS